MTPGADAVHNAAAIDDAGYCRLDRHSAADVAAGHCRAAADAEQVDSPLVSL